MKATTRVDLHCHSVHSDGALPPRELAERLAAAGVAFASLTDHDTVDGLAAFAQALARRDVGFIPGVEITTQCDGEEAHLLGYGFDPAHPELQETLRSLRQARAPGVQSIAESLRDKGLARAQDDASDAARSAAPNGRIEMADAIALIHRAGGRAFLAHPFVLRDDPRVLEPILVRLKKQGLDGIEVFYAPYDEGQRQALHALAQKLGLLSSGGSDWHGPNVRLDAGAEMPTEAWKEFRDAVCATAHPSPGRPAAADGHHAPLRGKWRHFTFHILLPTVLAIALFVAAIFALFLPTFERSLLERKREMIRELTNSAWSILAEYEREERGGALSRSQAQQMARSRVEGLRYGRERKDYFWLQDMHPRMVMHPYRKDLNGQDLSSFRDARGTRIFVEFADLVRRQQEGYLEYVWQWKDDPKRLAPKESYIKGFAPWGWVIGTGIYIEDVRQEIGRIERSLVFASLGITLAVALLLLYVMQQGLRLEQERAEAEGGLRESTERYRSLVEATTEGVLLVLDGRCRYGNPPLLEMLGVSQQEMEFLDVADVLPAGDENEAAWSSVTRLLRGEEPAAGFEGVLRRRDGAAVACALSLSRISVGGRDGFIILARETRSRPGSPDEQSLRRLGEVAEGVSVGLFRARAGERGAIVAANQCAAQLLRGAAGRGDGLPALAGLFPDAAEWDEFVAQLRRDGAAERVLHVPGDDARTRSIALSVREARGAGDEERFMHGFVQDVTAREKHASEREALVDRLQTSLLFLHESVGHVRPPAVSCDLDTPIRKVAALMTAHGTTAALVRSGSGPVVGIVTDHDVRARVVAAGCDPGEPVHRVMSAPLVKVGENARVYEALLAMEEHGVQHLALEDDAGQIVGVTRSKELLQFQSYGAVVLTREITRAAAAEDVVRWCRRAPGLVGALLECGAHPRVITRMTSALCDAATERFIALAHEELGPAPASFAFLALGSQGRQEQTLFSDQDNAILYADAEGAPHGPEVEGYFIALGERVCTWLDEAGYPFCRGDVMARNPRWCRPLAAWKRYFHDWIRKAEPQQLLEFSIFFDFRSVHGAPELAGELRRHVQEALHASPAFFPHFAQNSLLFKPPLGLFGKIVTGGKGAERPGLLDLKEAMMPIVSFARLYALRHGVEETHTLERLDALAARDVLSETSHEEIVGAYESLMRVRLRHQAAAVRAGLAPDNLVNHRKLGSIEETLLKQSFAQIAAVQKRISFDFLGGT